MNRAFSKILILLILIILAGGGFFAWQYFVASEEEMKDETADWQTYRNEKYNIEFQYPDSWILDDKEALSVDLPDQTRNFIQINVSNGVRGQEDESMSPCQPGVASVVYQVGKLRDSQQSFEEFVNFQIENPERGLSLEVKPKLISTMVGGHNALKIEETVDNCDAEFYYIEQSLDSYTTISFIVDENDDKLVINQLLSTFRFEEAGKVEIKEPHIKIISPNGGEKWKVGRNYSIKVFCSKGVEDYVTVALLDKRGGFFESCLDGSGLDSCIIGDFYCKADQTIESDWSIPQHIKLGENVFKIVASTGMAPRYMDGSDNYFSISQ